MFSLIPKRIYNTICELTPAVLSEIGVRVLLMDFDNTIVPYTNDIPTAEIESWFQEMHREGICLCVVSNTKRGRAVEFCRKRGIDCITHAKKPFQKGIREALKKYGDSEIALVGDQIFTDVLGANCGGITSILITPIHLHNVWLKLRHLLELPFISIGKRRMRRNAT